MVVVEFVVVVGLRRLFGNLVVIAPHRMVVVVFVVLEVVVMIVLDQV